MQIKIDFRKIDSALFNTWLNGTFSHKLNSIVHDSKKEEVLICHNGLQENELLQIKNYYEAMPVFTDLQIAKNKLKKKINDIRDFKVSDVFVHEIQGVDYRFHCDDRSAIRLSALANGASYHLSQNREFLQNWRDFDNNMHELDAYGALDLFASARIHEEQCVFKAVTVKESIDMATWGSVEEIEQVDALQLWENS